MEVFPLDLDNPDSPVETSIMVKHDLFGNLFIRHEDKLYCILIDNNSPITLPIKEHKLTPISHEKVNYGTGTLVSNDKPIESEITEKMQDEARLDREFEEDEEYFPERKNFSTKLSNFYRDGKPIPFELLNSNGNVDMSEMGVDFSDSDNDQDEDEDNEDKDNEEEGNVYFQEGVGLEPFFVFYNYDPKFVNPVGFPSNSIYHFLIVKGGSTSKKYIYMGEEERTLCPYRLTIFTDGIIKCNVVNEKISTYKFQIKDGKLTIEKYV